MRRLLLLTAAVAMPLAAQQPAAAAAPAPLVQIDTVGPAGWRLRLAPTNLGSLLASEAGQNLWQPLLLPLEQRWRQLVGGGEPEFAAMRRRLLDYGGRVQLLFWVLAPAAGGDSAGPDGRAAARVAAPGDALWRPRPRPR